MSRETAKLFTPENILHVGKMREQYFKTGSADGITGVREEILKGWKLSYNSPFREPYSQKPTVRNLQAHLERSKRLLDVAIPYMKKLHSFLQQKSFWLTLLDDKGVIIKLVGSPEMLAELTATGLVEGSDRGSDVPYCGLFHLEYLMKKPFMLVATEHASPVDDNLAGAACPIIDLNKEVPIGFLAVSGHWWDSHVHTLGLVIIAAEAISQQIRLREANLRMKELNAVVTHVNHRLKRTVENVNSGLIYIDNAGRIKMINRAAVVLLGIKKEEADVVGTNVFAYLDADITVDIIRRNTADGKTFQYALSNSAKHRDMYHTRSSLYLFVNTMGGDADEQGAEYIIQVCKQNSIHKTALNLVYLQATYTFDRIIGRSEEISEVKRIAKVAAAHDTPILLLGESGTGKELFAQAVHNAGPRAGGPFIAINCGAIPRALIESELFGYEPGAFTGADKNGRPGKFELADGGTLFLDEIGDMPYDVQVTLLRVLQAKEVVRIGSRKAKKIDVRIISATNQDLEKQLENRTFRSDLYYRLNVFTVMLPSLRERPGDIAYLTDYFIDLYNRKYEKMVRACSTEVVRVFNEYAWPGNIRELENVIEHAVILSENGRIELGDLPDKFQKKKKQAPGSAKNGAEKERLIALLQQYEYNVSRVANELGISRPTLYKKMKACGISKKDNKN